MMKTNHFFVSSMVRTPPTIPTSVVLYKRTLKNTRTSARKIAQKNELRAIVEFAKQAMKSANQAKNKEEELNNFDDLSISTTGMHSE